jgi:hypothetical protein
VHQIGYRGDGSDRPAHLPLPPRSGPLFKGWRLRKHWRYVGAYGEAVSIVAARVNVGPIRQEFWGIWHRETRELTEHSRLWVGRVAVPPGLVRVRDRRATIDLTVTEDPGSAFEVVTPVGRGWTWTRKPSIRVSGTARVGSRTIDVDATGLIDENDGYHPRLTHWWWAAGTGRLDDGRTAVWNAVIGLNDVPPWIENTVWIDGQPFAIGPVTIARDLSSVRFEDGSELTFRQEAERATKIDLLIIRSAYRQPFGTFTGTLPGGLHVAEGYGVMEDHRVLW